MDLRANILKLVYRLFPFDLKGDLQEGPLKHDYEVSCIINFYGRIHLLEGILFSLLEQNCPRTCFEVILVEDRGGTEEGRSCAEKFSRFLNISYHTVDANYGVMGYSRNLGTAKARGRYILFLDDDTVILQKNFIQVLIDTFNATKADGIIPHGHASFHVLKDKYGYHEAYFPTSRCMSYQSSVLMELGGFVSDIIGQEDVEFTVRFLLSGKTYSRTSELEYYHPPLLMPNLRKPKAVGNSFYRLKSRYPFVIWVLLILNCSRYAPLYLLPVRKYREMSRFSMGFLLGVTISPFKKVGFSYN